MNMKLPIVVGCCLLTGLISHNVVAADMDQDQIQQHTSVEEPIYGSEIMTEKEREMHRQQMRELQTEQEREAYRLEHHNRMLERAREQGVTIPETPPVQGAGTGKGMGSGAGQGQGGGMGSGGKGSGGGSGGGSGQGQGGNSGKGQGSGG